MAVTITPVAGLTSELFKAWDILSDANGDTTAVITHGLTSDVTNYAGPPVGGNSNYLKGNTPHFVHLTPLLSIAYVSQWCVTGITSTQITLTKVGTGGGDGGNQLRVYAGFYLPGNTNQGMTAVAPGSL